MSAPGCQPLPVSSRRRSCPVLGRRQGEWSGGEEREGRGRMKDKIRTKAWSGYRKLNTLNRCRSRIQGNITWQWYFKIWQWFTYYLRTDSDKPITVGLKLSGSDGLTIIVHSVVILIQLSKSNRPKLSSTSVIFFCWLRTQGCQIN
jgi:hypothetical protein